MKACLVAMTCLAASSGVLAQAIEGNATAGQNKSSLCAGCHGIPGYRTAYPNVYRVPKLSGQHPAYIRRALQAYRSGERSHPSMRGVAASLSDRDMADLAAYYGSGGSERR